MFLFVQTTFLFVFGLRVSSGSQHAIAREFSLLCIILAFSYLVPARTFFLSLTAGLSITSILVRQGFISRTTDVPNLVSFDSSRVGSVRMVPAQAQEISRISQYLTKMCMPTRRLLAWPASSLFNFLASCRSYSRFSVPQYAEASLARSLELQQQLVNDPPEIVLFDTTPSLLSLTTKRQFELSSTVRQLLKEEYERTTTIGSSEIWLRRETLRQTTIP